MENNTESLEANEEKVDVVEETTADSDESKDIDNGKATNPEDDADRGEWYILQCFTGHESKVKLRVEQIMEEGLFDDKLFRIIVPEEETIEIRNNKRVEKISKIFPGYVFLQMLLDENLCYRIQQLAGVSKFVGSKHSPSAVREDEILRVLRKVGDKTKKIDIDFEIGEVIKVISGPFRGYAGPISEINVDKGKMKSLISIFGRETPVELEFSQVEKAIN